MSLQARQAVAQTLVPLDNKPAVTTEDALASKPPFFEQYALANARYQGMLSAVILSKDAAREGKLRWYQKVLIGMRPEQSRNIQECLELRRQIFEVSWSDCLVSVKSGHETKIPIMSK
jgi:hypothetical protein